MAIARLSSVVLISPRSDVGVFLSKLCTTGLFHPSDRRGLVQDIQLVILSSKAHAVYHGASSLLKGEALPLPPKVTRFQSDSLVDLIPQLSGRVAELSSQLVPTLDAGTRAEILSELTGIRDAALAAFNDISRVRVRPGPHRFIVTEGFVPTESLERFTSAMGAYFLSSEPISRRQPGVPYVPSLLVNPKAVKLFEGITLSLGVPKYNEVDPTPIVAFVFPLFFGIMFSDLGRGLALIAAGYAFRHRWIYLSKILQVLGASAMAVGALRGYFFGLQLPYPAPLPSPSFLVQGPNLASVSFWLEVGIVIGTFHLAAGYVLAIINHFLSRDYPEAFLGYLPTLSLYASTIPLVFALAATDVNWGSLFTSTLPTPFFSTLLGINVPVYLVTRVTIPVLIASLAALLFGRSLYTLYATRRAKPALSALAQGLGDALVRPAELFIHTVSYVRLGILLVVGSALSELLGTMFALGPRGILVAILGNAAVISIEAFIVYVQDLRLNVYEWFSKFYSGVGKPFAPLVLVGENFIVVRPGAS